MTPQKHTPNTPQIINEWADIERYHLIPGFFQVVHGRQKSKIERLEIIKEYKDTSVKIIGPYVLRPFDLVLLCSVVSMAGKDKVLIPPSPSTDLGQGLRDTLELKYASLEKNCLYCQTTLRGMAAYMGYKWGKKFRIEFETSLERIFSVSFIIKKTRDGKTLTDMSRLLSSVRMDDNKLHIGINPVAASALLGEGHYARIDMDILRDISSSQKILYAMLCNACAPGQLSKMKVENIRQMLYGDAPASRPGKSLQISRAIKQTMKLCESIGWTATQTEKNEISIKRPRVISC